MKRLRFVATINPLLSAKHPFIFLNDFYGSFMLFLMRSWHN